MGFPADWSVVRLDDVALDLQPGFAQRPGSGDSGVGQIRTHNITPEGQLSLIDLKYVSPSEKETKKYTLKKGDIIFNNTNSEEWVGKTALFDIEAPYLFSNHMTRIRVDKELVSPSFLALYLHFLWKAGFSKTRAKRWVSQAAIDQMELSTFKVPLPTILEQQRIVEILKQADELSYQRSELRSEISKIAEIAFIDLFRWYLNHGYSVKLKPLRRYFRETQYGISDSLDDHGEIPVLRMNNLTEDGWLDLEDLKYFSGKNLELKTYGLAPGDLVFNRTNSRELVGKTAIWMGEIQRVSFASYLVRIRLDDFDSRSDDCLLPEYLWGLLNSPYGKAKLLNMAKQAVNMANISPTDLGMMRIPIPPIDLQKKFRAIFRELRELRTPLMAGMADYEKLNQAMINNAFSGQLTERWRSVHRDELETWLREHADILPKKKVSFRESAPMERTIPTRPTRLWLMNQLSEFQSQIYKALLRWESTLVPSEDLDMFLEEWPEEHLEEVHNRVLRALDQLAGLGLIARVSVQNESGEYATGYRVLKEEEFVKLEDLERLEAQK